MMCADPKLMNPCPPMPGNGMNITISIDLGNFMNPMMPGPCDSVPPSTPLTKTPPPIKPCPEEDKTICFLDKQEGGKFDKAKDSVKSKFGEKHQKEESKDDEKEECEEE